ncbi:MAG: putative DNA binding domain-containing protein, partial [Bacteroidales bacterium]|nr:putative DNA binding domain-containing protein [Bacteroidales bacterium]
MLTSKQILKLLSDLESDRVERTISTHNTDKFCEAVCAFANDIANHNKPGYLIIGARDNGELSGLKVTDELLLNLASIRSDGNVLPQPALTVQKYSFDGGDLAVVEVQPSVLTPLRYKGKIWIRIGPRKAIANESEEKILIEKRISQAGTFDTLPCLDATLDDIKTDVFSSFYLPRAIDKDILKSEKRSIEYQLASLRFYDLRYNCPTYAAIILFGKNPEYFLPGAYLQYVRFVGDNMATDVVSQYKYSGNLCEILPKLDSFVETSVSASRPVPVSALREENIRNYPHLAIRELLMNSLMHRDYQTNTPARFYEFNRSIMISNPGNLYGNARPENFPAVNDYRNPIISEAMKVLGFVNKFRRGIYRVKDEL